MENASKALLIAGGVLIAILIITIGVYLFATYAQLGETYDQTLTSNQIVKVNNNFTKFEGREDITAQEIVTLYNFIKEKGEISAKIYVNATPIDNIDTIEFIKNNSNNADNSVIYFKCIDSIEYNENTGIVEEITFTE